MNLLSLGYFGLFLGAFLAGSFLPFPSEALLIGSYEMDEAFWLVLFIASLGNWIGGLTNYWIGYKSNSDGIKKRFKLDEDRIHRWEGRLSKWGVWLGLLSWVPFVGDPMVGVLGFFRVRFWPLAFFMLVGKFGRYFVVLWVYMKATG